MLTTELEELRYRFQYPDQFRLVDNELDAISIGRCVQD